MFLFDVLSIGNKQRNTSQSLLRCDLFAHLLFDLEGFDDDEYEDSMSFVLIGEALTVSFALNCYWIPTCVYLVEIKHVQGI